MITFYLICISITFLLTSHREAKMWQNWIFFRAFEKATDGELKEFWKVKNSWWYGFYQLITCSFCCGFWTAAIYTAIAEPINPQIMWLIVSRAFISAILSVVVCSLIEWLNK